MLVKCWNPSELQTFGSFNALLLSGPFSRVSNIKTQHKNIEDLLYAKCLVIFVYMGWAGNSVFHV